MQAAAAASRPPKKRAAEVRAPTPPRKKPAAARARTSAPAQGVQPTRLECWRARHANNAFSHIRSAHRGPLRVVVVSDLGPRNALHGRCDMATLEVVAALQGDCFPEPEIQKIVTAEIGPRLGAIIHRHPEIFDGVDAMVIEQQVKPDPNTDRMEVGMSTVAASRGVPFEIIDPKWRKKAYADFFGGVGHDVNKEDAMALVERILTPGERALRDGIQREQQRKKAAHARFGKHHKTQWDDFADVLLHFLFFASAVLDRDLVAERLEKYAGVPHEHSPAYEMPSDIED
jgi:hypothetical protein